jgi:hypothetical protein
LLNGFKGAVDISSKVSTVLLVLALGKKYPRAADTSEFYLVTGNHENPKVRA